MVEKHLQKNDLKTGEDDPFGVQVRKLYFREQEIDNREHSEKVKDRCAEAGNDTRNADNFVKLVNAHLQNNMSKIEKIKAEQNRFWDELDMFKSESSQSSNPRRSETEDAMIVRDLTTMINKYGIEKLINALDKISKQ
jgi:predicted RNase H-like nuclease (RuvC/YqgF family)